MFSPLLVKLAITKARTYAEDETPIRLASASRANRASFGSLKLKNGSPLRGYLNAEQIHHGRLTRKGCVERGLGRLVVANQQVSQSMGLSIFRVDIELRQWTVVEVIWIARDEALS